MISLINSMAQQWFTWQVEMLWQTAVLIAIIWGIDLLIRKWAWPQVRYALWMLVLVKLLTPPTWTSPASVTAYIPAAAQKVVSVQFNPAPIPDTDIVPIRARNASAGINAPTSQNAMAADNGTQASPGEPGHAQRGQDVRVLLDSTAAGAQADGVASGTDEAMGQSIPSLSWKVYAMLTWLAGMAVLSIWLMVRLRALRNEQFRIDSRFCFTDQFCDQVENAAAKLKLKRRPAVILTDKVSCPAVFGVFRPVLLMPECSTGILPVDHGQSLPRACRGDGHAAISARDTEHILLHELAHIKRGDLAVHAVYMVLQIAYWFNPLLWMIRKTLQNLRELCCDATVARLLRENTVHYRQTLLETARQLVAEPVDPGLGLLGLFENSNWLLTRLKWLEKKTWKNRTLRIATIVVLVLVMAACVMPMANRPNFAVTGKVVDAETGAPVAGAEVYDDGYNDGKYQTTTDENGKFTLKTANEEHFIAAAADGYEKQTKVLKTFPFANNDNFDFRLTSKPESENDKQISAIDQLLKQWFADCRADRSVEASALWHPADSDGDIYEETRHVLAMEPNWTFDGITEALFFEDDGILKAVALSAGFKAADDAFGEKSAVVWDLARPDGGEWKITQSSFIKLAKWEYSYRNAYREMHPQAQIWKADAKTDTVTDRRDKTQNPEPGTKNYTATLPNGVTVELLGLGTAPWKDQQQWWKPDGVPFDPVFHTQPEGYVSSDGKSYVMAVKVQESDDSSLVWGPVKGVTGSSLLSVLDKEDNYLNNIKASRFNIDPGLDSTHIQVGIATGQWTTQFAHNGIGTMSSSKSKHGIAFSAANQIDRDIQITVSDDYFLTDYRLVAVGRNGDVYTSSRNFNSARNVRQSRFTFENINLEDVKDFQFQTRPYEWVTFKNVSLRPGVKTDVEVSIDNGRMTKDEGKGKPQRPEYPVDFEITSKDFQEEDSIEITNIVGTSPKFEIGQTYTVTGTYTLASANEAMLHIYATNGETRSEQGPVVKLGSGEFVRTFTYLEPGDLHLSFYPAGGGSGFGSVYFAQQTKPQGPVDIAPAGFKLRFDEKRLTYDLVVSIQNKGEFTLPKHKIRYYRGDPNERLDETGNPHTGWHNAGPIEPGKTWNESTRDFHLPDGNYTFTVILDYDNTIEETDEDNNRAVLNVTIKDGQIVGK